MDARSWRYNLEANLATDDADFVAQVERSMRDDLRGSEEVDPVAWAKRPWTDRLREWWFYLFRKTL
jgi:phosphatidylserine/phosphatidylglycerophosphate/cardiolipin synthase-like enzyme